MKEFGGARLRQIPRHVLPALVFCAVAWFPCVALCADPAEFEDWRISREVGHFQSVATARFMELVALKPGMTVLDIGTGTGQFAFEFAERLRGTGRVFATDIDNGCINRVTGEARRRRLDNLYPVLVNAKGVDEFYGRHRYDLVTLVHVPIPDRTAYLATMRSYLKDDARLIIVVYKRAAPFSPEDFAGHFPELVRELSLEPAESPFSRGLRESTRQLLMRRDTAAEPGEALRNAVVEDFNRMLSDVQFGLNFIDGRVIRDDVAFTPAEKSFADYLLVFLIEEGVFYKRAGETSNPLRVSTPSGKETRVAQRFNKLLFLQRFRRQLDKDRLFKPGLTPRIRDEFERAGYRLENDHRDIMPFEDVLVFRPDRETRSERVPERRN